MDFQADDLMTEKTKPKRIEIPFNSWSTLRLLEGTKSCTSRNRIYGKVGDWFRVENIAFSLEWVSQFPLGVVRNQFWKLEGADSPKDFERVWKSIYRGKFDEKKMVYVHFFRRIYVMPKLIGGLR